jgi:mannose-6-phosphate isomerase-like protein (cupin superfamily)
MSAWVNLFYLPSHWWLLNRSSEEIKESIMSYLSRIDVRTESASTWRNFSRSIGFHIIVSLMFFPIVSLKAEAHGMKVFEDVDSLKFREITGIGDFTEPTLETVKDYESLWVPGFDLQSYALQSFIETGESTNGSYTLAKDFLPTNFGPPPHIHSREDEWFYVTGGEVTFLMEDSEMLKAQPGTLVFGPREHLHGFFNSGNDPATILNLWQPSGIEGFFRETGVPLSQTDPLIPPSLAPNPAALMEASLKYGVTIVPPSGDNANPYAKVSHGNTQAVLVLEPSTWFANLMALAFLGYLVFRRHCRSNGLRQ